MGGAEEATRSLGIWNSLQVDRGKREILKAAVVAEKLRNHSHVDKLDDIIWVLKEATRLEDARNDAVHSPLLLLGYDNVAIYAGSIGTIVPDTLHENPRARKLLQKQLLEEFRWASKVILILRDFVDAADYAWMTGQTWPDRPSLPGRPAKTKSLEELLRAQK